MITSVSNITQDVKLKYQQLFKDLTILLLGYESIRVYNADNPETYYYRENEIDNNYVFSEIEIDGISAFEEALAQHTLYIKAKGKEGTEYANGWDGIRLGFISDETVLTDFSGITSLEEYLSWLYQIKEINEDYVYHYMRLPIDEELFVIDANARTISIPSAFKKNGIAVQGDDVAEDIYFSIDRYFDVVDFNNCEVFIQWVTPKKEKVVVRSKYRDIASDPGKLIFGCPISSAITKDSGNVNLSIQLVQYDEDGKISYSFNTLTISVKINASIGINLAETDTYKLDDVGSRLIDRIKFVEVVGGAKAAEPEFILDVNNGKEYDLPDDEILTAQAISSDTGAITYIWRKKELDENNDEKLDSSGNAISGNEMPSEVGYVEIDEDQLINGRVYYYKRADDENYTRFVAGKLDEDTTGYTFYQMVSICHANGTGSYYVTARNRITNSVAVTTSTNRAKFLKPTKPEELKLTKTNNGFFNDNGEVTLEIFASKADNEHEVQTYQWQYKANKEDNFENIEDENAKQASYIASNAENGKGSGYYTVIVTNSRNTESVNSDIDNTVIVRVTNKPTAPAYTLIPTSVNIADIDNFEGFTITLDEEQPEHDEIRIKWYVYQEGYEITPVTDEMIVGEGTTTLAFNPKDYEKKIGEVTDGNIVASYFPALINYLNGETFSTYNPEELDSEQMFKITPSFKTEEPEEEDLAVQSVTLDNPIEAEDDDKLFFED